MAVTQYIGARYVPKLYTNPDGSNEWLSGISYEALTIVTYNQSSYTSKLPVPSSVGNPESNPSYWVETGNYNAYINGLTERVEWLEGKRRILAVGDSYLLTDQVWDSWGGILEQYLGCPVDIAPTDGGGFYKSGAKGTFQNVLSTTYTDRNYSDIVVCGGANDTTGKSSGATEYLVKSGIVSFIQTAKQIHPNARIWVGFISQSTNSAIFNTLGTTRNWYRDAAVSNGARFIDLRNGIMMSEYMVDYLHPTQQGSVILGNMLAQALNGGVPDYQLSGSVTVTPAGNLKLNYKGANYFCRLNYGFYDFTNGVYIDFPAPQNLPKGMLEIGTIDSYIFEPTISTVPILLNGYATLSTDVAPAAQSVASFYISGNAIRLFVQNEMQNILRLVVPVLYVPILR